MGPSPTSSPSGLPTVRAGSGDVTAIAVVVVAAAAAAATSHCCESRSFAAVCRLPPSPPLPLLGAQDESSSRAMEK